MPLDEKLAKRLEPGEQLLWSGRPRLGLLLTQGLLRTAFFVGAFVVLIPTVSPLAGMDWAELVREAWREQPVPLVIGGLIALMAPFSGLLRFGRHRYAVTDRRLLAWRGSKLYWELGPPYVLYVAQGIVPVFGRSDLRFNRFDVGGSDRTQRWTSFHAISDPGALKAWIEEWLRGHEEAARRSSTDRRLHTAGAGGFSIELPQEWRIEHRRAETAEPAVVLTAIFDGNERPAPGHPADPADSNVLVADGPHEISLVVESHAGEPPEDLAAGSRAGSLAMKLAGARVGEAKPSSNLGFEGELLEVDQHGKRMVGPRRQRVHYCNEVRILRGAGRWYRATARWPSSMPAAQRALGELIDTWTVTAHAGRGEGLERHAHS